MRSLGSYIALNLEGSSQERTFSLSIAENLIAKIQSETDIPIVIVHGPKGEDKARELVNSYNNVYRLSLSPSIKRSAAIIKDAYIAITPDTSILHMASAYNTPVVAIYADYKTRWPAMADVSESVVVGQKIDNISLDEFAKALKSVLARISIAENLIAKIQSETDIPIVIVHGPKGEDKARELVNSYNNVYRLSLSPSIKRSAAIIKDAYIAITPDTSILHMASAYNTPVVAIYADYKTRWPAMADVSESVVVGQKIDNISLDEFAKALKSVLARI